jgi:hypothetical protein
MDLRIIDMAFAFDGWVYGGWVRDTCVLKQREYNDIDLCFPKGTDINKFIKVLKINMGAVQVSSGDYTDLNYLHHECYVVTGSIFIDLTVYNGTFEEWSKDRTTDMSCNLFYKSKSVDLGLRYIPRMYDLIPNPMEYVKELTRKHQFDVLFCQPGEVFNPNRDMHINVVRRMKHMEWDINHIEDPDPIIEILDDEQELIRYLKSYI